MRTWRAVAGAGFAVFLGALLSLLPARAAGVYVIGVPNIPEAEWTANCGPAALADVMQYYDPSISYREIFARVYDPAAHSTFLPAMAHQAARMGFHVEERWFASASDPRLEYLAGQLEQGHPVIVAGTASLEDASLHMRVVVGLDARGVWMVDPLYGPGYVLSRAEFERTMSGGANAYLVVWRGLPAAVRARSLTHVVPRWPAPTPHQLAVRAVERAYDRAERGDPAGAARRLDVES
ncbi:MAG: C39 family peptidase, partial [bacterium]|nr:C39 family peptidase [bacterium]